MTWKTALRDELVSRIQPTGLTVYMVYDPMGGCEPTKQANITKRDWQDELITALTTAGINVVKATWDIDTYDNRGILIMFFPKRIVGKQKFLDMIDKATAIKWMLFLFHSVSESEFPNFRLTETKKIRESDGQRNVQVWKREKVNV